MDLLKGGLRIFFSGIGGSGVSSLAAMMAERGHMVTGSDRAFDADPAHPVRGALLNKGIRLYPQDGSGIDSTLDLAVFSTAVEPDTPEALKVKSLGVQSMTRPEFLALLSSRFRSIAVAGTSGKSTTSGMIAYILNELGMSPNFIGGGRVVNLRTEDNAGNALSGQADTLVMEACESDGSIVHYHPELSVILNLALDHHAIDETSAMFSALIQNTHGPVVYNADDALLRPIMPATAVGFAIDAKAKYRAADIKTRPLMSEFSVDGQTFTLNLPGVYNVYNALAAIASLCEMGIAPADIARVLPGFKGIERRFQIHLNKGGVMVIDDYAHNPHKIDAIMSAMKSVSARVLYIFQPHGFAPVRLMKAEYAEVFDRNLRDGDGLALLPVYYSGGTVSRDVSSMNILELVRHMNKRIADRETLINTPGDYDAFVVMGARDESLGAFARQLAASLGASNQAISNK